MTSEVFYRIWSEWDLGEENYIFTTEQVAKAWIDRINKECGVYEDGDTIDDIWNEYQGVYKVEVIE